MEVYNNKVCVTYGELTEPDPETGTPVIGRACLRNYLWRHPSLYVTRAAGQTGRVRIDFYALPERYRRAYTERYGDPREELRRRRLEEELKVVTDAKAEAYYRSVTYRRGTREVSLSEAQVRELTVSASVMNRLTGILTERRVMRAKMNGSTAGLLATTAEVYERMHEAFGHTLPASMERLGALLARYRREGYGALLSGRLGNSSSRKITEEAGEWIVAMRRSAEPVYNTAQIWEEYNRIAPERGWKPLKSERAVRDYLKRPEIEPLWYDAVYGKLKAFQRYGRKHRTALPTMRDSLWYGDGTKLNLYYRKWVEGKGWTPATLQVYEVVDAYSEALLGYCISETEGEQSQREAYRMAIETSGHRPYEIVHDNQGGHQRIAGLLGGIVSGLHRPTAPYSGQSKTIESIFGRFQAQVLHKDWRFTGQNITAKRDSSRPNLERIGANLAKLYTLGELEEAYARARREWNEGRHPATGESRIEMYRHSANPDAPAVTAAEISEMFGVMTERPSAYTDSGIKIKVGKKSYTYEVFDSPGVPSHGFLRANRGRRFFVKYAPRDMSAVRLYTRDADGGLRFEAQAREYITVHRNRQEQTAEDRAFIAAEAGANLRDRIQRQIAARAIARKHGTDAPQQGLRQAPMAGVGRKRREEFEREIRREAGKKARRERINGAELSPGRVTKEISNMLFDQFDGIKIDMVKTAAKG